MHTLFENEDIFHIHMSHYGVYTEVLRVCNVFFVISVYDHVTCSKLYSYVQISSSNKTYCHDLTESVEQKITI